MAEAEGEAFLFQSCKFIGVVKSRHGKMLLRWLKVLADGHDVAFDRAQVPHDVERLIRRLAHADDQARLRGHAHLLGPCE